MIPLKFTHHVASQQPDVPAPDWCAAVIVLAGQPSCVQNFLPLLQNGPEAWIQLENIDEAVQTVLDPESLQHAGGGEAGGWAAVRLTPNAVQNLDTAAAVFAKGVVIPCTEAYAVLANASAGFFQSLQSMTVNGVPVNMDQEELTFPNTDRLVLLRCVCCA